jgi:hypothetical protein
MKPGSTIVSDASITVAVADSMAKSMKFGKDTSPNRDASHQQVRRDRWFISFCPDSRQDGLATRRSWI